MPFLPAMPTMADQVRRAWAGRMAQRRTIDHGATAGRRAVRLGWLAVVLAAAAGLAGCAVINEKVAGTLADMPAIGLPAGVPQRPAEQFAYPAVHDMPEPRSAAVMSEVEQQKMENDLVAAREAQKEAAVDDPPEPP